MKYWILKITGALLLLLGALLFLGNRTGKMPTFPYAGAITMAIGALAWGMASLYETPKNQ